MAISAATNWTAAATASAASGSQASTGGAGGLTEEEKKYDVDGDGTLSITEKAAYLEARAAKSKEKALESAANSAGKSASSKNADTVSISEEALKLQKEGLAQGPSTPPAPDAGAPADERQLLANQAIAEYAKFK
jgi:hypothetical protein